MTLPHNISLQTTALKAEVHGNFVNLDARIEAQEQFEHDESTTTGLDFGYKAGRVRDGATVADVAAGVVSLTGSENNYVEVDPTNGSVSANTTGFSADAVALYTVTTDAGSIAAVADKRTWVSLTGGGGGGGADGEDGEDGSVWRSSAGAPSDALGVDGDFYLNTSNGAVYSKAAGVYTQVANIRGPQGIAGGSLDWKGDWLTATGYVVDDAVQNGAPLSSYRCKTAHTSSATDEPGIGANWEDYWILFAESGEDGADGEDGTNGTNGTSGADGATWRTGSGAPSNGLGVNNDLYYNTATGDVYKKASGTYSIIGNIMGPQGPAGANGVFSSIASQAEAEAGTNNTKGMTPLRTAQAISALGGGGGGGGGANDLDVSAETSPMELDSTEQGAAALIFTGARGSALDVAPIAAGAWTVHNQTGQNLNFKPNNSTSRRVTVLHNEARHIYTNLTEIYSTLLSRGQIQPDEFASLVAWWKADSLTLANNDPVSSWTDASGNSKHATQATGGKQPTFKSSELNGLPVVNFDGGDGLQASSVGLGAFTILTVFRASASGIVYEHSADVNANDGCYLATTTAQSIATKRGGTISAKDRASNWGLGNTWRIVAHRFGGTQANHKLSINGVDQSMTNTLSNDVGTGTVTTSFNIFARNNGGSAFVTGDLAELIVYNENLSDVDLTALEAYLNDKYEIY